MGGVVRAMPVRSSLCEAHGERSRVIAGSSAIRLHKPSDVRVRGSSSITSAKPFDQSGDLCSRKGPVIPSVRVATQTANQRWHTERVRLPGRPSRRLGAEAAARF